MNELKENSYAAQLWLASGKNITELENKIRQLAQEQFINAIKPTKEQINKWKATTNGKMYLQAHISSIVGRELSLNTLDALWRLFTGREIKSRNRKVVLEFNTQAKQKVCVHCLTKEGPFHVDHIVPLALGGADQIYNLQYLCQSCNTKKGMRIDENQKLV